MGGIITQVGDQIQENLTNLSLNCSRAHNFHIRSIIFSEWSKWRKWCSCSFSTNLGSDRHIFGSGSSKVTGPATSSPIRQHYIHYSPSWPTYKLYMHKFYIHLKSNVRTLTVQWGWQSNLHILFSNHLSEASPWQLSPCVWEHFKCGVSYMWRAVGNLNINSPLRIHGLTLTPDNIYIMN